MDSLGRRHNRETTLNLDFPGFVRLRFAVMAPGHPVEYVDLEGIIPDGHYGAGPVVVWDEGSYAVPDGESPESQLQVGTLVFTLHGRKPKGGFTLTRFFRGRRERSTWQRVAPNYGVARPCGCLAVRSLSMKVRQSASEFSVAPAAARA
jgi:hypothetical protein